jgi:hypothetical protein
VKLVNPPTVQGAPTPEVTRTAILRAALREEYFIDQDLPGRIRARYQGGDWFMSVEIEYADTISIHYFDSRAIDYQLRDGVPYIHRGYNYRAQELLDSIQRELELMAAIPVDAKMPSVGSPRPPEPPPAR